MNAPSETIIRLAGLRQQLAKRDLDGFIVPIADEHVSEYVGSYAKRLEWLTGFQGSAGTAVVLPDRAALFVDGRYSDQVRKQVDVSEWTFLSSQATPVDIWLAAEARPGARIGFDPWLHTARWVTEARPRLRDRKIELQPLDDNPVDAIWQDRPARSDAAAEPYDERYAGESSVAKRQRIGSSLSGQRADALILSSLDSIAWLLNIRGRDIHRSPLALAFAILRRDGAVTLFIAPGKVTGELQRHLGADVTIEPYDAFAANLRSLVGRHVVLDPDRTVYAVQHLLEDSGATVVLAPDPTFLAKAIKNRTEITGHRQAQRHDGAALTRFLRWIAMEGPTGAQTECSAAAQLERFRRETDALMDLSFDTISAFGPNASAPHYRANAANDCPIMPGSLYLVDSGGQYLGGTTDVTRTTAIGPPSDEMRARYTQVLKGHIALASAIFPAGTRGGQLDALARQFLWEAGVDYAHGTGHGVGAYLCVHEGPQRISYSVAPPGWDVPLEAGMILSNEPGYYKPDEYGIRIENLVLVGEVAVTGSERRMLGFETTSYAPLDRELINATMLTSRERQWVDDYHRAVIETIGDLLPAEDLAWLERAAAPLA